MQTLQIVNVYSVCSLFLCRVNDVRVYLGGLDIGVSKHRLDCINVRAKFKLERSIRMESSMHNLSKSNEKRR